MLAKPCRHRAFVLLLCGACLGVPGSLTAQEKKEEQNEPIVVLPWLIAKDEGLDTCAWVSLLGAVPPPGLSHPWGVIGARLLAGHEDKGIPHWKFEFTEVFSLPREMLDATVDDRPLPKVLYQDYKKLKGFYPLLCKAVEFTHKSTLDMFTTSAEEFKQVRYADLKATPQRYRGKVITVKGMLKNIREVDTFRLVADDIKKAMPKVYTGWVLGPGKNLPPFTVVFTDLPPEIAEPSENLDITVTFHGYFLAFINYPPDPSVRQKEMISPYLVGKTLIVRPAEKKSADAVPPVDDKDNTPVSEVLVAYTLGGILAVALLVGFLNFWLRRGDRKIQARIADMRARQQPFNLEPADDPPAAPPQDNVAMEESPPPP